jgi:hypothetical protein
MPGFDGTGPRGQGSMTGRGEGYCALVIPPAGSGYAPYGFAGLQGTPVWLGRSAGYFAPCWATVGRPRAWMWPMGGCGRQRGARGGRMGCRW